MTPSEGNAPLPELHNTVVVAAFEGWNDAGDAASDAVAHLAASWQALPIVEIDDEAYYDYQVNRPVIRQVDGVTRELQWPAMRISHCRPPGSDRDVVLMCGVEPNMRWRTFCDELLAVIDKLNVDTVVILGALLADTPHTRPCRSRARPTPRRRRGSSAFKKHATRAPPASPASSNLPVWGPASRR